MGPLLAALTQKLIAYGLMAASGLIVIFAAGYALDAVHSLLMYSYGGVVASIIIAGSLLITAPVAVSLAIYLRGRPHTSGSPKASPYSNPPTRPAVSRETITAIAAVLAGALTAATVIAGSKRLRMLMARDTPR